MACVEMSREIEIQRLDNPLLVGVARGGLVPLRMLSDRLPSFDTRTITVSFYDGIGVTKQKPEVVHQVQGDINGYNVILVDDISDTGESLITASKHVLEKGAKDVSVVAIAMKPHTRLIPNIYSIETSSWIIFPWEVQETIKLIVKKAQHREDAERELDAAGIGKMEYEDVLKARFSSD